MEKKDIRAYTYEQLQEELSGIGEKAFRGKQIYEWLHAVSYTHLFNTESPPVWQGNFLLVWKFLFLSANGTGRRKDTSLVFRKSVIMICQK